MAGKKPKQPKPAAPAAPKPAAPVSDTAKTEVATHKGKKYRILHGGIVPGFNEGKPLTALEISSDAEVLEYLVQAGAANLVEVL